MSFARTLFIVLPMVGVALAVLIFVADRIHRRPIAGAALVMGAIGFVPVWVMIPFEPNVPPATLACFLVIVALLPGFSWRLTSGDFMVATAWCLVGLSVAQLTQGTLVANLGFSEIGFPAPVFAGDTLYAGTLCTGKGEPKPRPGEGIVNLRHVARNQDGGVVAVAGDDHVAKSSSLAHQSDHIFKACGLPVFFQQAAGAAIATGTAVGL
mgnify:CR=1 FL=1